MLRRFLRNRRERASGPQLWLIPVCWIIGPDDDTIHPRERGRPMKFRAPGHPCCKGSGIKPHQVGMEERGKFTESTKEYRCPDCGRWLRPSGLDTLPYHHKAEPIRVRKPKGSSKESV